MTIKHITPLHRQSLKAVHAVYDNEKTWCGWKYVTDEYLGDVRVPQAASTSLPLNCYKCQGAMRSTIMQILRSDGFTPASTERLLQLVQDTAARQRRARTRKDADAIQENIRNGGSA